VTSPTEPVPPAEPEASPAPPPESPSAWSPPEAAASAPADQPPSPPPAATRTRPRFGAVDSAAAVVGLIILAIGIWFFLDRTLGFEMPRIEWGNVWPIFLIVIGGLIVFRAGRD
jgi:uncharacterized membrane protein